MNGTMRALISAAIQAPSGENSQPWRFHPEEDRLRLYHAEESDRSLYNYNGWGTLAAHGAAIENIVIEASRLGYATQVRLLPEDDSSCVAEISITKDNKDHEDISLASAISGRVTNRKAYRTDPLAPDISEALDSAAETFDGRVKLVRFGDAASITRLAQVGSTNERIMLGNQELHSFFFTHLTWSLEEEQNTPSGFYIKTLELPSPIVFLFKILRFWPVARALSKLGFPSLVGKGNAATYASSAEIGVITIPYESTESFIHAGRLLERLWLTATAHDLQFQPLTGTLFMGFFGEYTPHGHFSASERELISREVRAVKELSGGDRGIPALMYRIGYGSKPTARSIRYPLEHFIV